MMLVSGNHDGTSTCLVTPDETSQEEIRRFELDGLRSEKAKELMRRYVLALQVAKYVVGHAHADHPKASRGRWNRCAVLAGQR
jgi:hypothetical protein